MHPPPTLVLALRTADPLSSGRLLEIVVLAIDLRSGRITTRLDVTLVDPRRPETPSSAPPRTTPRAEALASLQLLLAEAWVCCRDPETTRSTLDDAFRHHEVSPPHGLRWMDVTALAGPLRALGLPRETPPSPGPAPETPLSGPPATTDPAMDQALWTTTVLRQLALRLELGDRIAALPSEAGALCHKLLAWLRDEPATSSGEDRASGLLESLFEAALHLVADPLAAAALPSPGATPRRVYVSHRHDTSLDLPKVCGEMVEAGTLPLVPSLYLPCLDVAPALLATQAPALRLALLETCEEMRVVEPPGTLDPVQEAEILHAEVWCIPVVFAPEAGPAARDSAP